MRKTRIQTENPKRANFKLRSANPSCRRRKRQGYLQTSNSPSSQTPNNLFRALPISMASLDPREIQDFK